MLDSLTVYRGIELLITVLVFIGPGILSECLHIGDLPVFDSPENSIYFCIRLESKYPWKNDIPLEACNT